MMACTPATKVQVKTFRPHDLLCLEPERLRQMMSDKEGVFLQRVLAVVRRDLWRDGRIPVGFRGVKRSQRFATWIDAQDVSYCLTPEDLVQKAVLEKRNWSSPQVEAILAMNQMALPFAWGVGGSCGYSLAIGQSVMHDNSDLDIILRCPQKLPTDYFDDLQHICQTFPFRVDVQVNTDDCGFSLTEWLRGDRVLVKTNFGPQLVDNPWQIDLRQTS